MTSRVESTFRGELPQAAGSSLEIVRTLRGAGHVALLAGGCVRDLLLGQQPQDYDVATDARPDRVCQLFRATRKVGVQFGVVLVRAHRRWVEVATFRADGPYLDGRHPAEVTFSDARQDALRRDFTVNGMFLDPEERRLIDYVGGQADLKARLVRAIGAPARRFAEDYLRLLRAVRFAARLEFEIEPVTLAAIRATASSLVNVAPERIREELEKMLVRPTRRRALQLLVDTDLLTYLWPGASWRLEQLAAVDSLLSRYPEEAPFELAFAGLVADRAEREVDEICRALTFSNEQRENVAWLVRHQADLDEPSAVSLAALKRLLAHASFGDLRKMAGSRYRGMPDGERRRTRLDERLAAIPFEQVQPAPWVTGDDLVKRGIAPGPIYKEILDELYTQQLNETLATRAAALAALEDLLRGRPAR